jgi:hypothetical protein
MKKCLNIYIWMGVLKLLSCHLGFFQDRKLLSPVECDVLGNNMTILNCEYSY